MALQAGDDRERQFADIVHAQLAPLGIDVRPVIVDDLAAALRNSAADIQLAALRTGLDYPDPGSFLTQMLGKDVPAGWLPSSTRVAVDRLAKLTGSARDRAAHALADRLATGDVPIVAYGTPGRRPPERCGILSAEKQLRPAGGRLPTTRFSLRRDPRASRGRPARPG
jgi:hypothetical protein